MKIKISSVHFDADQKLLDFIDVKVNKLIQFFDGIIGAEVILRLDKDQEFENKVVEIRLLIPGYDLFAKKQCKTFEEATDTAIDALKSQISKHRAKIGRE
jgi:putative sigma-54 modulation protein